MKAKKRYVIGFWVAISLVVVLAIGMVAVVAAFNATAESGFQITYSAGANVNAEITAKYKVGSAAEQTVTTADGTNKIVFDTSDTAETVTKSFNKVTGVSMTRDDDAVLITYTIANKDTENAVKLMASANTTTSTNLKFEYSIDNTTWKENINDWKWSV